jgi:hypothetical protein
MGDSDDASRDSGRDLGHDGATTGRDKSGDTSPARQPHAAADDLLAVVGVEHDVLLAPVAVGPPVDDGHPRRRQLTHLNKRPIARPVPATSSNICLTGTPAASRLARNAAPKCSESSSSVTAPPSWTTLQYHRAYRPAGVFGNTATVDLPHRQVMLTQRYALAESFIGLYKTELIRRRGPLRNLGHVEFATLEYVDWFDHQRLHGEIGMIPPAEHEANHYRQPNPTEMAESR